MTRYRHADVPQRATPPQRTRVDWGVAKARYIELGADERSYARIHREFGVSEVTVQKWAKRDGWVEAAREADEKAAAAVMAKAVKSIEERNVRTIQVAEKLRTIVLDEDTVIDPNVAARSLPRYVALEQLIAGEATARVELGDVQAIVTAVFTVAGRFVPADRRDEFMAELDGAVGGLAVIEGGVKAA